MERLQLLTIFSGYPLLYTFIHFIAGRKQQKQTPFSSLLLSSLSKVYAVMGSIFLLLWIREVVLQLGIKNMNLDLDATPLKIWALLACLFWIPALAARPVYSFLHSLVFFALFFKDLITGIQSPSEKDILSNNMKVYTVSLVLNFSCLLVIFTGHWIIRKMFSRK